MRPADDPRRPPALFRAVVEPLQRFFELEAASGILLLAAAAVALAWANAAPAGYRAPVDAQLGVRAGAAGAAFTPADALAGPVAAGTAVALAAGKQAGGILGFTAAAVKLGLSPMPRGATWPKLWGVSIVAGIGFTVALFIAALAFPGRPELLDQAKVGIVAGSALAGLAGAAVLRATRRVDAA